MCDTVTIQMITIECANCHQPFVMTKEHNDTCRRDGSTFYCPLGHHNFYPKNELAEAKKRIVELEGSLARVREARQHLCDRLELANRRINSLRGWVTRLRSKARQTA